MHYETAAYVIQDVLVAGVQRLTVVGVAPAVAALNPGVERVEADFLRNAGTAGDEN